MKNIMLSIQPKWVEKIASGEKTIEVRKTRPKIETPFKCYIYCTKEKYEWLYAVAKIVCICSTLYYITSTAIRLTV